MQSKSKYCIGNWKMNMSSEEVKNFFNTFRNEVADSDSVSYGFAVPAPYLSLAHSLISEDKNISLGFQNVYHEPKGAYTGEVSIPMLQDLGGSFSLVGHSERRTIFNETDHDVSEKIKALFSNDLYAVLCVGENQEQYSAGETEDIVKSQLASSLQGVSSSDKLLIAYEPIWAIGTGLSAEPNEAQRICSMIKQWLSDRFDSDSIPVLYGGSANEKNVAGFIAEDAIDGFLVGGASLKPSTFAEMIKIIS